MPNQTHRAPPRYKIPGFFSILLGLRRIWPFRVNNLLRADRRNERAASIFHAIPHTGGSFHNPANHAVYFPAHVELEADAEAYAVVHIATRLLVERKRDTSLQ